MTIIVFLIDTSASMNQQAFSGGHPTLLDVAKGAVETFVKVICTTLQSYCMLVKLYLDLTSTTRAGRLTILTLAHFRFVQYNLKWLFEGFSISFKFFTDILVKK